MEGFKYDTIADNKHIINVLLICLSNPQVKKLHLITPLFDFHCMFAISLEHFGNIFLSCSLYNSIVLYIWLQVVVCFFFSSLNNFSCTPLFIQLLPISSISYCFRLHLDRIKSLLLRSPSGSCTLREKYVIWEFFFFSNSYMIASEDFKVHFQKHTMVCDCSIKVLKQILTFVHCGFFFSSNYLPLTNLHNIF